MKLIEIIKARDIEQYKAFVGFNNLSDIEQDIELLSFERLCRSYHKEYKSPDDYLIHGINGFLSIAAKRGIHPFNALKDNIKQLERPIATRKPARRRTTKARRGDKPAGVTPYGYRYADDKKTVLIDAAEAAAVKRIFSLSQAGRTIQQIVNELNGNGLTTRRGNAWTKATVHGMLRNPFYTGVLTHQRAAIAGNHEAIISKVQFGKAQKQLERRHK